MCLSCRISLQEQQPPYFCTMKFFAQFHGLAVLWTIICMPGMLTDSHTTANPFVRLSELRISILRKMTHQQKMLIICANPVCTQCIQIRRIDYKRQLCSPYKKIRCIYGLGISFGSINLSQAKIFIIHHVQYVQYYESC